MKCGKTINEIRWCAVIGMLSVALSAQSKNGTTDIQESIVIMAEQTKGHVSYRVDSEPATDLLLSLARLEKQRGPNCPVLVFLDPRLPIQEMWTIDGVAGKAQLANVRYFIVFRDTGKMSELHRMPAVPFSKNPTRE
jgi:hypothetical protein